MPGLAPPHKPTKRTDHPICAATQQRIGAGLAIVPQA